MADHYTVKLMSTGLCSTMLQFEVRPYYKQSVQKAVAETLEQIFGMSFEPEKDNYVQSGLRRRYYYEATEVQS